MKNALIPSLIFLFFIGIFYSCQNSSKKEKEPIPETKVSNFSLTDGKLGYPTDAYILYDINFDGNLDSLVVLPGAGQRGRTDFIVYDLAGNELISEPYTLLDSETKVNLDAKELSIVNSGGACETDTDIYQRKELDMHLVKRLKQTEEDGKCMESTYDIIDGEETFVSKRELTE